MSIPGLGDAITLFDLAVRVTTFINDLRHAQDDFIGLRSEADCLRICLGSLTSESCQNALYHYITIEQGQDLKQIVDNCKFNMMDLNVLIAACAKLGDDSSIMVRRKRDYFKKIAQKFGKGFTRFKFAMTDKQPFRDKLMLPTASINIFLTSMTHVGLVNMGRIMMRTGHAPGISNATGFVDADGGKQSSANVAVDELIGWQAVGTRMAFRDTIVKKSDLTRDFEAEMLEYALHLIRGGVPFHAKPGTASNKHKVTKTTRTKTGSRSRSRGPLGLGKGGRGQKYVMRKKSVSIPSSEKVEIVTREWESGSDSDPPRRPLLALPAPDSTSSRQYVEIKPSSAPSSDEDKHLSDEHRSRDRASGRRHQRDRPSSRDRPRREPTTSREEIRSRRRDMQETIRAEQADAYEELEQEEILHRSRRAQTRVSRPAFQSREEETEYERYEEEEDLISFLAENYGLIVQPLLQPREPVDHGVVKDVVPPTAAGDTDQISDSEDSEPPLSPPPRTTRDSHGRRTNDRLRAQVGGSFTRMGPSPQYGSRFETHTRPYGPSRYRPGGRPNEGTHKGLFSFEEPRPAVVVDEEYGSSPEPSNRHRPRRTHYGLDIDDLSEGEGQAPKRSPRPRPPGPTHGNAVNEEILDTHGQDILFRVPSDKRQSMRADHSRNRGLYRMDVTPGGSELRRTPSRYEDEPPRRHLRSGELREPAPESNMYMRGARLERDSDSSNDNGEIRLIR